jgi:hypothetical protein
MEYFEQLLAFTPDTHIGKLWRDNALVKDRLGWAYEPQSAFVGRIQYYDVSQVANPPNHLPWYIDHGKSIVLRLLSLGVSPSPGYYIPEAQVWGDGRILWVQWQGNVRKVLEGHLTPEQMTTLLQQIVDAGFFDWPESSGAAAPYQYLSLNLIGQAREVTASDGAPPAFYTVVHVLESGAEVAGVEYSPAHGYLTAWPVPAAASAEFVWPSESVGFDLEAATNGLIVEGEALAFAWQAFNQHPRTPVYVQSGEQIYTILVEIPGVSFNWSE